MLRFRRPRITTAMSALLALGAAACTAMSASSNSPRLDRMRQSPQYAGGTFRNTLPRHDRIENGGFFEMLGKWVGGDQTRVPREPIPVAERQSAELETPPASGLRITWMGHSSMLIDIDGFRVLTDPVWSERASPVSFAGPKRFWAAPIPVGALPRLDAVVLSHDHYDHLDESTIRALSARPTIFLTPLGVGAHLERWGVASERIVELDWWQQSSVGGLRLVATPARHFSGRGLNDRNETLWSSWAIIGPRHRVFFSGDTGMTPEFAEIGTRLGPFDATMIESGAYNALWTDVHLGPEQAVLVHELVGGKLMLPIHWGTFNLALHSWTEPAERLVVAARRHGINLAIPRPGESVEPAAPPALARWWPEVPWQTAEQAPIVSSGVQTLAALGASERPVHLAP